MSALAKIAESIAEHRLNAWYYQAFQRDNPVLAPLVLAYLDGGARPTDAQLGQNHYAKGLVFAEDARRILSAAMPAIDEAFGDFDAVVSITSDLEPVTGGFRAEVAHISIP